MLHVLNDNGFVCEEYRKHLETIHPQERRAITLFLERIVPRRRKLIANLNRPPSKTRRRYIYEAVDAAATRQLENAERRKRWQSELARIEKKLRALAETGTVPQPKLLNPRNEAVCIF